MNTGKPLGLCPITYEASGSGGFEQVRAPMRAAMVTVLLAAVWANHPQYAAVDAWLTGKSVVVCPISELGFLRKKAVGVSMDDARKALEKFLSETKAQHLPDDLPALESRCENSEQVTDQYLATLAERHGYKLATLDTGIQHRAAEPIQQPGI